MSKFASFRRPATIALALTLSLGLAACGDGGTTPTPTPTVDTVTVTTNDSDNRLTVGQMAQATANVAVTNGAATTVTWSSSNTGVATVDQNGMITAVTPGTAVITATSTADTSKSSSVTITVVAAPVALTPAVKINFQPATSATPSGGFVPNTGAAYNSATGIGWITEASAGTATRVPLNLSANTRDRTNAANRVAGLSAEQYTQLNMQCGPATDGRTCFEGDQTPGAFEYRVVNGTYNVTVSVGESVTTDFNSRMVLNVEGTNFVNNFVPSGSTAADANKLFAVVTKTVTVSDGSLTVDAKGGVNTKIQYLNIAPAQ